GGGRRRGQHGDRDPALALVDQGNVVADGLELALLRRDDPAGGRRQVAGDDVGVVGLGHRGEHAPAGGGRDAVGAGERAYERGHVGGARRVVVSALGGGGVHHPPAQAGVLEA